MFSLVLELVEESRLKTDEMVNKPLSAANYYTQPVL